MTDKLKNLHRNHRQRLKNRFLNQGLDGFEPHNILELLLFFSVPQGDTNELAHILLNKFGSLSGVFSAPYNELKKVKGVGDHTATMLKLMPELFTIYAKDRVNESHTKKFSVDDVAKYLLPLFISCDTEVVRVLYFDTKMNMMKDSVAFTGDVNSANLSYKDIASTSLTNNWPNVIIAHNHPNGNPMPSMEDIRTTNLLHDGLAMFNINLIEHIVISGSRYSKVFDMVSRDKSRL
ncbi:MAG: hypothetical protein IJO74_05845 [Clostridia bacterium]|nr:hypothetical protein [Clostridia bacterium]